MIYIAESGSTKCDAVFLENDGVEIARIRTIGFNPYFHSSEFIEAELKKVQEIVEYGPKVEQVYFFGAGCSSPSLNQKVAKGLKGSFPNANIEVDHDLMACAYATYTGESAISCILGTGSNAVYFDGESITKGISGLGYILGDEGSASYIGKKVLSAYLYKQLPEGINCDFEETFKITPDEIRQRVYNMPHVNVFLGSFAPFAHKHIELPFFYNLVYEGFESFIKTQVKYFPQATEVPIHFVGSIAHHFQNVLEDVIRNLELNMGQIVRRPLDGLVQYYLGNIHNTGRAQQSKTLL